MKILGKLLIAFLSFTTVAVSSAQGHPNFTGTWKLNVQRSDTSSTGITALVVDVIQQDPAFTYTAKGTQGGQSFEETETFTTDGKPSPDSHGATIRSHWEDTTLVTEVTGGNGSVLYVSRFSISNDGKTATRILRQGNDQQPHREIYEKQ